MKGRAMQQHLIYFGSDWKTKYFSLQSYEGERIARISYSLLACVNIASKSAKDRTQKRGSVGDDMWDILRHHLRWMQLEELHRFSHKSVKSLCETRAKDLKLMVGRADLSWCTCTYLRYLVYWFHVYIHSLWSYIQSDGVRYIKMIIS